MYETWMYLFLAGYALWVWVFFTKHLVYAALGLFYKQWVTEAWSTNFLHRHCWPYINMQTQQAFPCTWPLCVCVCVCVWEREREREWKIHEHKNVPLSSAVHGTQSTSNEWAQKHVWNEKEDKTISWQTHYLKQGYSFNEI